MTKGWRVSIALGAALAGAACREAQVTRTPSREPLADSADQVAFGAREFITANGVKRAELQADTAFFFDENTRIEMRTVHTIFYTTTGVKRSTLTSRAGTLNSRLNSMQARGNVVVVSEDGRRLVTPELSYDKNKNEISSDSAFVFTEPNNRLEGIGFRSDPDMKNIVVLRQTKARTSNAAPPR